MKYRPSPTPNSLLANANADGDGEAADLYQFWNAGTGFDSFVFWTPAEPHSSSVTANNAETASVASAAEFAPAANTLPMVAVTDHSLAAYSYAQIVYWISYSDANNDQPTWFQFWDSGTAANSARFWTASGGFQNANTTISVATADLPTLWVGGGTSGSETLWVRAFDGQDWSNWDSFTLTTVPNSAPVVAVSDHSLVIGRGAQVAPWISYSDANGEAAVTYQFWDGGAAATSARFWTTTGGYQNANTTIEVSANDLGNVWIIAGTATGSETLWVRAFDGHDWGNWDSFTLTTAATNTAPVVAIADHSVAAYDFAQVGNWVSWSDINGDVPTQYQFWDGGTGANSARFWTVSGGYQDASTSITINAANLMDIWVGGGINGSETMWVRAFDGESWGAWDSFTLTTVPNSGPVATISDHSLVTGRVAQVGNWVSWSDANGDVPTEYQFWDGGTGANSARFWTESGGYQNASTAITVNAADLFHIWAVGGTAAGTETMYVRAFDGHDWGAWDSFNLTTVANTGPAAVIADQSLALGQFAQAGNWVSWSDANGDVPTEYQFWDGGTGANSARFWTESGGYQNAGTAITVNAADLFHIWVGGATAAGTETMYVRAFDGFDWGAWDPFVLTSHV